MSKRLRRLPGRSRRHPRLPIVFAVATILLSLAAVWAGLHAKGIRDTPAMQNRALVDVAATSAVKGQVAEAIGAAFSYSHTDLGKTEQAAKQRLVGEAIGQYKSMMREVKAQAAKDKIILSTTVTDSGVTTLTGDRAELLIFVDQTSSSAESGQSATSAATFAVTAVKHGDRWKVSNIDTFSGAGS